MGPEGSSPLRRLRGMRLLAQLSSGEKGSVMGGRLSCSLGHQGGKGELNLGI